jgi:hypothetical protein
MMQLRTLAALAVGMLTATFGSFEAHTQPSTSFEARTLCLYTERGGRLELGRSYPAHLSLVSHPKEVADLILAAAGRRE